MKDWMKDRYRYPDDKELSYDQLRQIARAAWDAIPDEFFEEIIQSMQARCRQL